MRLRKSEADRLSPLFEGREGGNIVTLPPDLCPDLGCVNVANHRSTQCGISTLFLDLVIHPCISLSSAISGGENQEPAGDGEGARGGGGEGGVADGLHGQQQAEATDGPGAGGGGARGAGQGPAAAQGQGERGALRVARARQVSAISDFAHCIYKVTILVCNMLLLT